MNRYSAWKYVLILVALFFGTIYTPSLQINSAKSTVKVDSSMQQRVEEALKAAHIDTTGIFYAQTETQGTVRVRFPTPDMQFKAKEIIEKSLNPDQTDVAYSVTFNEMSNTPTWLQNMHALPMFLGLDLRGGVPFLMQVDTEGVLTKRLQGMLPSLRT